MSGVQPDLFSTQPKPWETSYNGTGWVERCAVNPIQRAHLRSGRLIRPTVCTICLDDRDEKPQGRDFRFLHLEDYSDALAIYPCCKPCHAALHARFRNPMRWQGVLERHGRPGEWFTLLSLDPASQWRPFGETYPKGLPRPDGGAR
jgi:hypothetical protein